MKEESIQASKITHKHEPKKLVPVMYGQKIHIKNLTLMKEGTYLWGRGFIDTNIYLSKGETKGELNPIRGQQIQAQFTIQPKKGLYNFEDKTTTPVVFGAQVLIKHVLSQQYIAIGEKDGMPNLEFQTNQSSACYFQFSPLRTFESNGDAVTTQSIFHIVNTERKLYLTDIQQSPKQQPDSPTYNPDKRISINKEQLLITERPYTGSVNNIPFLQNLETLTKQQLTEQPSFKKKMLQSNVTGRQSISFRTDERQSDIFAVPIMTRTSSVQVKLGRQSLDIKRIKTTQNTDNNLLKADDRKYQDNDSQTTLLPIYNMQKKLVVCSVENYSYSKWKIQLVRTDLKTHYLNNNDFIYFTHSQANQTMVVDIEKYTQKSNLDLFYIKNTNDNENQFLVSSIFVVEIQGLQNRRHMNPVVYLKHFLTQKYFPFEPNKRQQQQRMSQKRQKQSKKISLIPLLAPKKNQCPPFRIQIGGKTFNKKDQKSQKTSDHDKETLHGFWVNKIPKTEIAQIMSMQYVDKEIQIQYFMNYLKENTKRRQNILRQFQYIPHLINQINKLKTKSVKTIQQQQQKQETISKYYQILFYICRNNEKNKKQCLKYIEKILNYHKKDQIIDLLTELLIDNSNIYSLEKVITPNVIQTQIRQFIDYKGNSSSIFMRIFRVFCGSDEQPSVKNQCLLFNLFFWGQKVEDGHGMTQSVVNTQRNLRLPERFKFRMFQKQNNIYFSNGVWQLTYEQTVSGDKIIQYIRQYLYLLSDCMNGNNYPLIKKFTQVVSFDLLLKSLQKFHLIGPALSLIYHAYLKPQKKYKSNIFHNEYEKICDKGSLIYYCNNSEALLRNFLDKQLRLSVKQSYTTTTFRILLNVFKLSIQNGYWKKFEDLIDLMGYLDGLIQFPEPENAYHHSYEQKAKDRNLLRSKITAISIKIVLIDMQVSLWASNFKQFSERDIQQKIVPHIKNNKNWIIDQKILKLCSTSSPQLIRKAILLLYKIYNLYKLTRKAFQQAQIQFDSVAKLGKMFETVHLNQEMSIQNYFSIISACIKDPITLQQISPQSLKENDYLNLQSMFKYRQVNEQVQNIVYKLGLHESLIKDVKQYTVMQKNKKYKQKNEQIIYWKLLTIYALIRYNSKLRDIIAENRNLFISFIESEHPNYYVAVDIIEQIYRNNRKLIISDNEELQQICKSVDKVFRTNKQDLRCCKVVNLLTVFIETGNRKIIQNYQIILKIIFQKDFHNFITKITGLFKEKKQVVQKKEIKQSKDLLDKKSDVDKKESKIQRKLMDRKQSANQFIKGSYPKYILRIVIYDLLVIMGQKKMLNDIERPNNDTTCALLLIIGNNNWSLKGKAFLSIKFESIKQGNAKQYLRIILYDLNYMCESMKVSNDQDKQPSKQVKMYISNLNKILETIEQLFKTCIKNLQKQDTEEQILVIKIIQRLFIMKTLCPETIHKKIDNLLDFIKIIEKRENSKGEFINLIGALKNIQIGDFQKNEIKEKLPLIYSQRIKNKKKIQKISPLEQKSSLIEQVLIKKGKIQVKINDINKNNFQLTQGKIKELKTLIISLSNLNKNDSRFLSDNIKQFLVNFVKTSFLQGGSDDELVEMQDILVNYQVPTLVCSILQEPFKHRYKLFCSVFELGIKLLSGGHTKCQQKFLLKFKEDGKNWIFQNIYQIIADSLVTIEFYYHYKDDPTIKSYQMMLQLEQYYICKQERKLSCELLSHAFRFLQLLCQNDNHTMKDYIYNQLDKDDHVKYMSKNFIQVAQRIIDGVFVVIWFNIHELQKMPNPKFEEQVRSNIFNLPIYILDFLIQVCQIPADQNQLYLCRTTDFLDFIKKLIKIRQKIKENQAKRGEQKDWNIFFIFEKKIVILLKSLLQQNSQQISNLIRKKIGKNEFIFFIQQSFTHGGLKDTDKLKQMLNQMQLNTYVENIVDILIIKKILKNQEVLQFTSDDPLDPNKQKLTIVNQLNNRIQSIHVDFKTHSLTVYFPFHPLFALLGRKTKDFLLDKSANLTTRREKLTQLLISREIIYQDINHEKNSERKMMNSQKMSYVFNFALFLCYLIVFLLVLFYSVSKSGAVLDIYEVQIISGLSYMQLLVSIIYTVLLGFNLYPIAKQKIRAYQALKKRSLNSNSVQEDIKTIENAFTYLKRIKSVYIDEADSAHAVILLIISLYACFFQVRVYSFSLIFMFAKIELLQSILKSIRLTWQQLVFVSLLALAFSFIFGFITLNNYIGPLYQNQQIDIDIDRINQHCHTIITCVISLFTQKIILESVSRQGEEYNYGRFVSDLVYWGFFEILLSNIIAAIIIDKFAQQRNVKQKILHDRYSKCYICFADRSTLERRGEDFMSHVNYVHNLWNYFFYIYTLENLKDITDFTGIQYWINRQIKNNMIDWIPIDDSFKEEDNNLDTLVEKLKPLLAAYKQPEQK